MEISISKKDIIWGYIAQFFAVGSGLVTLPLILNKLSPEEVGLNYIMLSIGALVALCDFGFSSQFSRNITYVLSGSRVINEEGLTITNNNEVDYYLLASIIKTAKYIYRRISTFVLLLMLFGGTAYIYYVTEGFTQVRFALYIWILYSLSTFFNLYFLYYSSLLTGSAKFEDARKAIIYSKSVYIILCTLLLMFDLGLISVVIANFIAPFVSRYYSCKKFYTKEMRDNIDNIIIDKVCVLNTLQKIWKTAKLMGINLLGSYACGQAGMFISGLFLSLSEIASYGLMLQVYNIITGLSVNVVSTYQPVYCKYQVHGEKKELLDLYSTNIIFMIYSFLIMSMIFIILGNYALTLIDSKTVLPSTIILVIYTIETVLHNNHAQCAVYIVTKNIVPFVKPSLISGFFIIILDFIFLKYTSLGILSMIVAPFIVDMFYNHWKWPLWVANDLNVTYLTFFKKGNIGLYKKSRELIRSYIV